MTRKTTKKQRMDEHERAVSEWEQQLTGSQLLCRDSSIHHSWEPYTAKKTVDGYERVLYCGRCGCRKVQRLDPEGYVVSSGMRYADGYLRPRGSGRVTRSENARMRVLAASWDGAGVSAQQAG